MLFNKKLAIIIPAFNEEKTIKNVVLKCMRLGNIIVINDCSSDKSFEILNKINSKKIEILNNRYRLGYDGSLNKGINFALKKKYSFLITYDADDQFYYKDIIKFTKYLKKNYQIVIGVRSYKQRFIENIFAYILDKKYGIKDPFCGLKGYNSKILSLNKKIFTYNSIGTEILLNYLNNIKKIKQIRIKIKRRSDRPRFGNILTANYKLLLAIINGYRIIK